MIVDLLNAGLDIDSLRNRSILITGSNGLIGSGIVSALILLNRKYSTNIHIFAMCRNEKKAREKFFAHINDELFTLLIQDVCEPLSCTYYFDYIFHLASGAGPNAFNTTPVEVMMANFVGTNNLLTYAKEKKTRVVFVSSSEVYGENFENKNSFSEKDLGSVDYNVFRSCYPQSKRAAETLCHSFIKEYGSDVVIARPAFIFGKEINFDNSRVDVYFFKQAFKQENIVMYSEGSQIRSYCHINDCVAGLFFIALKGKCGESYNISNNGNIVSLREYAQKICEIANIRLIIDASKRPKETTLLKTTKMVLDTNKLESLGWKPRVSLEEGIKEILLSDYFV